MKTPIKSKDLCEACKYDFCNWCQGVCGGDCGVCDNMDEKGACLCLTIEANTPCPYFKEGEANETD